MKTTLESGVSMESAVALRITKKAGVCGGDPIVAGTRIPVWWLENARRAGMDEPRLLREFPQLCEDDLQAAWAYVESHADEIDRQIRENSEA